MLLCEYASGLSEPPDIQIFATDIDAHALAIAREGRYTLNDAADVSPERLRRFFVKEGDGFKVRRDLRELVLFANHNLVKDPPFSHLDLVSCRNLLIYLNRAAQNRVMDTFDFALEPGGYLFLGGAEGLESAADRFVATDTEARIFQSRGRASRVEVGPPAIVSPAQRSRRLFDERPPVTILGKLGAPELHQRLLEKYAAPHDSREERSHDPPRDRSGRALSSGGRRRTDGRPAQSHTSGASTGASRRSARSDPESA
jgi:two-component system CheB/CheR fusion protein